MMLRRGGLIFRCNHNVSVGSGSWGGRRWDCGQLLASLGLEGIHLRNQVADVPARSLMRIAALSSLVSDMLLCTTKFSANSARGLAKGVARREGRKLGIRV